MKRRALWCGAMFLALGAAEAHAQMYCPSGEGGAAAHQAAVECQRQNLAIRRQRAAEEQARHQAYSAQAEAMQQARTRGQARQRAIHDATYAQRQAELSPTNFCAKPEFARVMLSSINDLQHEAGERSTVIDAEHRMTLSFDPGR